MTWTSVGSLGKPWKLSAFVVIATGCSSSGESSMLMIYSKAGKKWLGWFERCAAFLCHQLGERLLSLYAHHGVIVHTLRDQTLSLRSRLYSCWVGLRIL